MSYGRRYTAPAAVWPDHFLTPGEVVLTPQPNGTTLVSVGRPAERYGAKHLGMFTDIEIIAIWTKLGMEFGLDAKLRQIA